MRSNIRLEGICPNMKRVAQKHYESGDCGIACAAMLAGSSYEKAHEMALELGLRKLNGNYHTRFRQIQDLLGKLGIQNSIQKRSSTWDAIKAPAILKVNQEGNYWHWVVLAKNSRGELYILDPEPGRSGRITTFGNYVLSGNHIHVF